jgi:hypothetical protein
MVGKLCDRAVRVALGISVATAARLAGVARSTLTLYELEPSGVVTPKTRASCEFLYAKLRKLIDDMDRRRANRDAFCPSDAATRDRPS